MPKLCCCLFSVSKLTNLVNYSFWMTMSSFRLKTYFTRSFQHSVSILTSILAFVLQHLLKIRMARMIPSPVKHKQTKHNNKFRVISGRYMFPGFPYFQTKQYKTLTLSLWINIRSLSTRSTKQWIGTLSYPDFHARVRLAPFWIH